MDRGTFTDVLRTPVSGMLRSETLGGKQLITALMTVPTVLVLVLSSRAAT